MKTNPDQPNRFVARNGVSLIEVIACTALVAMLMLPMAGVLRTSGQAIRDSEGISSPAQSLPNNALTFQRYVQSSDAILKYGEDVLVVMRQGVVSEIYVTDTQLIARGEKEDVILADGIRRVRFENEYRDTKGEIYAITTTLDSAESGSGYSIEPWTFVLAIER